MTTSTVNMGIQIDAVRPVISSVSVSNNTSPTTDRLKVDQEIYFEIPDGDFSSDIETVLGTFNSNTFSFSLTGVTPTWKAAYIISEGHKSQTDASNYPELIIDATDLVGNQSTTFTSSVSYTFDATTPFISSLTHNVTTAGTLNTDDSIVFTLTLDSSDSDLSVTVTAYYNETDGGPIPLEFTRNSDGSEYIATYVVEDSHKSRNSALQLTGLTISDGFGNFDTISTSDIQKNIETSAPGFPSLVSLTSSFSLIANTVPNSTNYLKIGDSVQFTAEFVEADDSISSVTAEFNSQFLDFTSNTATVWVTTYTVAEGHPKPSYLCSFIKSESFR